jgi:hypothetical protein
MRSIRLNFPNYGPIALLRSTFVPVDLNRVSPEFSYNPVDSFPSLHLESKPSVSIEPSLQTTSKIDRVREVQVGPSISNT